jgi:hypothetical protein
MVGERMQSLCNHDRRRSSAQNSPASWLDPPGGYRGGGGVLCVGAPGTALKAGYRWLDVYCGGCRQVKPIDLAAIDIHPQRA